MKEIEAIRVRLLGIGEALARVDVAIEQLTAAARGLAATLPANHDATEAVDVANERARVARAKVEIVLRRVK